MAKQATKTKAKSETAKTPETRKAETLPARAQQSGGAVAEADAYAMMDEDAGAGVSTRASDNIVPLIYVLQAQSPQVLRQKPEYIQGAKDGDFWLRGTKTVIDGTKGLEVIWCHMTVTWFQWGPERGDGLRGRHPEDPMRPDSPPAHLDATLVADPKNPKRQFWTMENGDVLVQTREHVVLLVGNEQPYVIGMSSSNLTAAKSWMTLAKSKINPATGNRLPLFGQVYRLTTVAKSNDQGDWYGIAAEDADKLTLQLPNGRRLYEQARQLRADFESGKLVADVEEPASGGEENTSEI